MARTGRLGGVSFAKETNWGDYASATEYLRVDSESLKRTIEHTEDNSLVAELYTTDMICISDGIGGSIEGAMHGDEIGFLIHGILGTQSSLSNPVKAWLAIGYDGSRAYARVTKAADVITAEVSDNGSSWIADTNFSSTGSVTVTAAAYDTLSELSAYIHGRTGWNAVYFGDDCDSSTLAALAATNLYSADAKVGAALLNVKPSSSAAKTHKIIPAGATVNLPSFSFLINRVLGTNKSVAAVGAKINSLSLKASAKDLCKFTVEINAKQELNDKTDTGLTASTVEAFIASNMKIVMEENDGTLIEFDEVKDYSITINANLDDNRNIGSIYKKEQERQKASIEISFTANNSSGQYAPRTDYIGDDPVGFFLYWKSTDYADAANLVPFSIMIRIPAAKLTDYNSPLSTQDRLVITAAAKVVKNTNTTYADRLICYVVDDNTSSY